MGKLPRYQRLGVRPRQFQDIDYAGFRGQARAGQAMSQAFDQMSGFLYKKAEEQAIESGLERVRTEGAQPLLEQLQAQGGPRGLEEKTAYEAANRIAQTEIQNDAELQITKILDEAERNVTPFTQVQAQLADLTDGYAATLANIDPVAAGNLRSNLSTASEKAGLRYSDWYIKKQAQIAAARRTEVGRNDAMTIIKEIPALYGQDSDTGVLNMSIAMKAKDYVENQGWSQEKADAWASATREAAEEQWVSYKIQNSNAEDLETFIDNIVTGKRSITGTFTKDLQFANKAQTVLNVKIRASEGEARSIAADISEKQKIALNGGKMPDAEWFTNMDTRIETNGVFSAENRQAQADLKLIAANLDNWKKMSSEELADAIDIIKEQGIPGYEGEGADTVFEVEVSNMMQKLFASAKAIEDAKIEEDIALEEKLTALTNSAITSIDRVVAEQQRIALEKRKEKTAMWSSKVSDLSDQVTVLNELFQNNLIPNNAQISDLIAGLGEIPVEYRTDQYEKIKTNMEFLVDARSLLKALPGMTKEQVAKAMQELNEGVVQEQNPVTQLNNTRLKNALEVFVAERQRQVEADPILYASKVGVQKQDGSDLDFVPFDFTFQEGDTAESIELRIKDQFQQRKHFADMAQAKFGGEYKLFTKAERVQFYKMLDGEENARTPVTTQMSILSAMFEGAGFDVARQMMSEIAPDQPAYAFAGVLLTNPATAQNAMILLEGKNQVDVAGKKVPGLTQSNTESVHIMMIDPVLSDHTGMMKGLKKAAGYIYSELVDDTDDVDKDGKIDFNPDKYMQALNMSLGAVYDRYGEHKTGGILEYRGVGTIMPQAFDAYEMDNVLAKLTPENITQVSNLPDFDALGSDKEAILNQIRGSMEASRPRTDPVTGEETIETWTRNISDKFEMRLLNGSPTTGYVYEFYYPGTDVPLSFPSNPNDPSERERFTINLQKLDEAQ